MINPQRGDMSIKLLAVLLSAGFQSILISMLVMLYRMNNEPAADESPVPPESRMRTRCAKCAIVVGAQ